MKNKSQSKRETCRTSALNGISNNEFYKEYYGDIKKYMSYNVSKEMLNPWKLESLREVAEQEFINQYNSFPSCAVFAPETITIVGEGTDLGESKSLCMAIQLGTVIAGKLSRTGKGSHVKILLDANYTECRVIKIPVNAKNPKISDSESLWLRYIKETIGIFWERQQGHITGFKSVIVPARRSKLDDLSICTSLVVAVYTFLEGLTNNRTSNVFEKALACHLALKRVRGSYDLSKILTAILGTDDTVLLFDPRSLSVEGCNWSMERVSLFLVDVEEEPLNSRSRVIANAVNAGTRWLDMTHTENLYSKEVMCTIERLLAEDRKVLDAADMIRGERWKELGELFWENYRGTRSLTPSTTAVEHIMSAFEVAKGVLGAGILNRGYGASIFVLVQRSCWNTFVETVNRISRHQHYAVKPSAGATILYAPKEQADASRARRTVRYYRAKFRTRYHLPDEYYSTCEYQSAFEPAKSISLFIPRDAIL